MHTYWWHAPFVFFCITLHFSQIMSQSCPVDPNEVSCGKLTWFNSSSLSCIHVEIPERDSSGQSFENLSSLMHLHGQLDVHVNPNCVLSVCNFNGIRALKKPEMCKNYFFDSIRIHKLFKNLVICETMPFLWKKLLIDFF